MMVPLSGADVPVGAMRKKFKLFLEIASAKVLTFPAMWTVEISSWNLAVMNIKHLTRCIASLLWLVPLSMIATVAMLLHRNRIDWPIHFCPHIAAAITTGISPVICD